MLLSTMSFVMLGLGFMHQQSADVIRARLLYVNQQIKCGQQTENEMSAEGISSRSDEHGEGNFSGSEDPRSDDTIEIEKAISACRSSLDEKDIASFASIVRGESKKYGYDWELLLAIIRAESQFNVRARSNKGARGLMQVLPSTAKWLSPKLGLKYRGRDSLYDPEYNVKLGTHYLHMMHQKFGDLEKAIAAYNRGPTGLVRYLSQGRRFPPKYLEKVMGYYEELKNSLNERAS